MPTSTQIQVRHAGVRSLLAAMLVALLVLVALPAPRAAAQEPGRAAPPRGEAAEQRSPADPADDTGAADEGDGADAVEQTETEAGQADAGETDSGEADSGDGVDAAAEPAEDVTAAEEGDEPDADGAFDDEPGEPAPATAEAPTGAASAGEVEDVAVANSDLETWQCTPDGILFQAPTTIYAVDLVTGEYDTIASGYHDAELNAVGYNLLDSYIYGYANSADVAARQIIRVGADGGVEGLGNPDGVPAVGRHVGDVDENGHFWLANGTEWWQIDLDPTSPTYFELLASGTHPGIDGWGFADWAVVPGGGDYLYTVASQGGTDFRLFRFDRASHQWEPHGGSLGNLGGMGAVYADADGFLYGSVNASGDIFRIDVLAATAEFFAAGPASGSNDGAMCIEARVLLDFGDAPASYGTLLAADGARHGLRDFDEATSTTSLMLGVTVDPEPDALPSVGADTDTDDGVADPILTLPGEPTTVDVIVTNDTDQPATLAGWLDLAGTGTFDAGDRAPLLTIPANSGTATYTLEFPAGTTLEDTYARFRLFGGTVADPQPTGAASSGEVEDYLVRVGRVHFEKTVDPADVAVLQPGDTFTYTVTVSNVGGVDLTDLSFSDDLSDVLDDATYNDDLTLVDGPGTVSFDPPDTVSWSGDLASGESAIVTYSVTIDDPPGGDAVLFNAIVGEGPGSNCEASPPSDPACFTEVPQPQLAGVKTSDAAGQVEAGDTITYQLTISNTGPGAAHNAVAHDDLSQVLDDATFNGDAVATSGTLSFDAVDQQLTWHGPLAAAGDPGDSVTITYSVTVNDADELGDGQLLNALLLSGCPNPPVFDADDPAFDPDCVEIIDIAAWTSVKTSDATGAVEPGDTVGYTITLQNTGNVALTDPAALPSIADDLSEVLDDAVYNDDADAGGAGTLSYVEPVLSWEGPLLVGEIVTITYSVTVADAADLGDGRLVNAVTGAPNCPDPAVLDPEDAGFDPNCVAITDIAAYTVVKSSTVPTSVEPGDTVAYEIAVTNTGATALTGVDAATFADDLSGVLDDASYNDDASATTGTVGYAAPRIAWIGDLDVGQSATITYSVTVDSPIVGDFTLVNAVTGGDCPDPAITDPADPTFDPTCVTIAELPGIHFHKTVVGGAVDDLEPGDRVAYEVTVTNTGQVDLVDQSFTDDLSEVLDDASYADDAATDLGNVSYSEPVLTWTGDLAVGEVATVTYSVILDDPMTGDGVLRNQVIADGPNSNCPPPDPVDPDCSTVTSQRNIAVTKELLSPSDPVPGDVVTYRILAHNLGAALVEQELIVDDLSGVLDTAVYNGDAAVTAGTVSYTEPVLRWQVDIEPDATVELRYTVTVNDADDLGDGRLVNTVIGGSNCPPDTAECTTDDTVRAVTYEKVIVDPVDRPVRGGDDVTYQVTVANRGGVQLDGLSFTDDLSAVLEHATWLDDTAADVGSLSYTRPILSWEGDLEAGEVATVTYTVRLDDDAPAGAAVRNVVVGSGPGSNCSPDDEDLAPACVAVLDVSDAGSLPVAPTPTGSLPFTGSNLLLFVVLALGLLLTGSRSLRVAGRRRRSPT